MIPAAAVGAIHRLAWVTDEKAAKKLVDLAVQRGATQDDADEALRLWKQLRANSVTTIHTTGGNP